MKPAEKAPDMVVFLDNTSMRMYGRKRTTSIENDICVACGEPATTFDDELSIKEYTLSGMCQTCQNKTFGK